MPPILSPIYQQSVAADHRLSPVYHQSITNLSPITNQSLSITVYHQPIANPSLFHLESNTADHQSITVCQCLSTRRHQSTTNLSLSITNLIRICHKSTANVLLSITNLRQCMTNPSMSSITNHESLANLSPRHQFLSLPITNPSPSYHHSITNPSPIHHRRSII